MKLMDYGYDEHYMKLQRESAHYQRSYLERRQRDREFGRMCKSVMKGKK